MNRTTTAAALALMLALTAGITQAQGQSYVSEATLKARQESATDEELWRNGDFWRDERKWLRTWVRVRKTFDWLPAEEIARGKEVHPPTHKVVVLDPPLPKTTAPGTVQVEWFHAPYDGGGSHFVWGSMGTQMTGWYRSWLDAGKDGVPIKMVWRMVGKGPNLLREFNGNRRVFQEMVYAWSDGNFERKFLSPFLALQRYSLFEDLSQVRSRGQGAVILGLSGKGKLKNWDELSIREWWERVDSEETRARIEETDSRYFEMMTRGIEQNRRLRRVPQDPIILVNGKYLLTGQLEGRAQKLFGMLNWIVREEREKTAASAVNHRETRYPNQREPKPGELKHMEGEMDLSDGVDVKWLYSYIDKDGKTTDARELGQAITGWHQSLLYDTAGVNLRRVPVIRERGRVGSQQEVHQVVASLWGDERRLRRERVHALLLDVLKDDPTAIRNYEDARELLEERLKISRSAYGKALGREGLEEDVNEAKRMGRIMEQVLNGKKGLREPVFLIENQYVLATGNLHETLQSLNWLIDKLQNNEAPK